MSSPMKASLTSQVEQLRASVNRLARRLKAVPKVGREGAKASAELGKATLSLHKVLQLDLVQIQAAFFRFAGNFLGGSVCRRCSCREQP